MGVMADVGAWKSERAAGKIQKYESRVAAKQEEVAAIAREADRKELLAEALASQNATAAASGLMSFEGSPLTVMREDMRAAARDTQRDSFQSNLASMTLKARGAIAERQAKTSANIGLIRAFESKASAAAKGGA